MAYTKTNIQPTKESAPQKMSGQRKGLLLVIVAVLLQGLGTSVVGAAVRPELSTFTTFAAFLTAAVFAGIAFGVSHQMRPTSSAKLGLRDIIIVNLVTAGAFSAFYVAAILIPPTAASVLETGLGPFVVALATGLAVGRRGRQLLGPGLVLFISFAIAYVAITSDFDGDASETTILGLILSVISGCCAAGVLLTSHRLSARGVTALQISAVRFHLAWLLCGIIAVPTIVKLLPNNTHELWFTAAIGVVCIAIPILLLQWGITLAQPLHAALVISTLPAVVLVGDFLLGGTVNPILVIGMTALVLISRAGVLRSR
jgi:drug/metabolite transporter (DMT)-like permease